MVLTIGIELTPPKAAVMDDRLLGGHRLDSDRGPRLKMVLTIGIEPMTSSLPRKCSTD